eukprot:3418720-Rhodomonas_salina.2
MAKAERVYQFEVARLCDVTRETIWVPPAPRVQTIKAGARLTLGLGVWVCSSSRCTTWRRV